MIKLQRVRRCLRLPRNTQGRDFVVGDLHGHRALLEGELDRLGFDPRHDRLLSVGDLVDRGPDSLATLRLVEEAWFHPVLGNHELMLLHYLGLYESRMHSRKAFAQGGGAWVLEALARHRGVLMRCAERLASLPLTLHVDADDPFIVTHGDLVDEAGPRGSADMREADRATSWRANAAVASRLPRQTLHFMQCAVQVSAQPVGATPLAYVGHSPMREVTVHNSHVYIDQRASTRRGEERPPTVLEHRQFAYWLRGVRHAHVRHAAASAAT